MARDGKVRLYLGTRKGTFVAESDRTRRKWRIAGPSSEGKDVFHVAPDPRHPGTVYAAVNDAWWGPLLLRSRDHGKKWTEISTPGTPRSKERTPPVEAPSAAFPIKNLWHIEPGPLDEPKRIFLGADPGLLFSSDDEGASWQPVSGFNEHPTRPRWGGGAGGMCVHTILIDPSQPHRMYVGISSGGTFRSEDGGDHWTPCNRGVLAPFLPDPKPELGQCVHKVVMDAADPSTLYRQDHGGIYVTRDRGESWKHIGSTLEDDFGFAVGTSATTAGTAFFAPMRGQTRLTLGGQFQAYRWGGKPERWTSLVRKGLFPGGFGLHREGLAVDDLEPAGLYVGTTTGQLFASPDRGRSWSILPYQFPGIHSVAVFG